MFDLTGILSNINHIDTALSTIFLLVGIFLSLFLGFPQIRHTRRFFQLISSQQINDSGKNTVSPLQALLSAMSTSLGSGSIAGVPFAIAIGGPGALFWIIVYAFFGSVTKFTEVACAIKYRTKAPDGSIIGGPTSYLLAVQPFLAYWYGLCALVLFAGWSGLQAKALSEVYHRLGYSEYITGIITSLFVFYMLLGGAQRIGKLSSYLVPVMCTSYLCACLFILLQNIPLIGQMIILVCKTAFTGTAATGGFLGASAMLAIRNGVYRSAYVTEAGVGTAAFPHALAETNSPTDQGILAMYSVAIDAFFCLISGFVVLVTGVWTSGAASNTLIYDAFEIGLPTIGPAILIFSLTLFVTGTAVGNSFNGSKSFGFFTKNRFLIWYYAFVVFMMFLGAIAHSLTLWAIMDIILPITALPNLIGITILAIRHKKELQA
jgi:AGCS family alanine or glycine:cation symporter